MSPTLPAVPTSAAGLPLARTEDTPLTPLSAPDEPPHLSLSFDQPDCGDYKILQPGKLCRYTEEANYKLVVTPGRICRRVTAAGDRETDT